MAMARSRLESFLATLVTAVALAVLMVIAVEYWRTWKSPGRSLVGVAQEAAIPLSPRFPTALASPSPTAIVNEDIRGQLEAAARALGEANARVRELGEERNALLAERDELRQIRSALSDRLARGEENGAAESDQRLASLERQLSESASEAEGLRGEIAELRQGLTTVTRERDDLRSELAGARQRIAALSTPAPAPIPATPTTESGASRNVRVIDLVPQPAAGTAPADQGDGAPSQPAEQAAAPAEEATVELTSEAGVAAYQAGDYEEAERIWRQLAQAGSPRAQFHLGSLLFEGRVGQPDLVQAYVWLTRSVERGFGPALAMRERVRDVMDGDELARARDRLG